MKKFLFQLLVFSSPLLVYLVYPSYVLWKSEENFHQIDATISSKEKYLFGYNYNENNYGYIKWRYLNDNEKKTVWALGSSRVLQFRENMFDKSFYNAGYTLGKINDFRPFLNSIPKSKYPDYMIINLDQWMFNEAFDDLRTKASSTVWEKSFTFFPKIVPTYNTIYSEAFNNSKNSENTIETASPYRKIGMNAKRNNTGFRNDGSMFYGKQIKNLIDKNPEAEDFNYAETFIRIRKGSSRFEYGDSINERAFVELNELLKFCQENKIKVIAFLPPFADKVYDRMETSTNYGYLKNMHKKIKPFFDNYNFEVYDFSKMSLCNSNDNETIDGFHGSETTYQRMLISMLNSGSVLNKVTSLERLKTDLANRKNNYVVYDDEKTD
ncbi:hypothetical protein [Flavobacterium dankookense]|uniref:DltD-like protein n=1 Tax=Flavobacterium dankookense TaxID=706186 RepID=A0A4R6QET3_9FLAO|nr:hypothetical protein [Flavobacterium dankookense]TDP61021.1 DltD-like protein [Flavobacterium dankookense]